MANVPHEGACERRHDESFIQFFRRWLPPAISAQLVEVRVAGGWLQLVWVGPTPPGFESGCWLVFEFSDWVENDGELDLWGSFAPIGHSAETPIHDDPSAGAEAPIEMIRARLKGVRPMSTRTARARRRTARATRRRSVRRYFWTR